MVGPQSSFSTNNFFFFAKTPLLLIGPALGGEGRVVRQHVVARRGAGELAGPYDVRLLAARLRPSVALAICATSASVKLWREEIQLRR